jgi:hypothetical protein
MLYLASKSNYQHILNGTLPSGVSCPEALAEKSELKADESQARIAGTPESNQQYAQEG